MIDFTKEERINIFKKTRELATISFYNAMCKLLKSGATISEVMLRDEWLVNMRESKEVFEDGWYQPPPHGIAVLFGKDTDGAGSRLNFSSLREQESWAKDDVFLDTNTGLISAYASIVDKESGIIGDFGLVIYFGSDTEIQNHLKATYDLTKSIVDYIQVGMTFSGVTEYAHKLMNDSGFVNEVECKTEPSLGDNIGHSIPAVYEGWTEKEQNIINTTNMEQVKDVISNKRIYLSRGEHTKIASGMAFTLEPRPTSGDDSKIPMAFYHTVCIIHGNGEKEFITGFNNIFTLVGMDYMLE